MFVFVFFNFTIYKIISKHIKVVISVTLLGLIVGGMVGYFFLPGNYRSEATVILNPVDIPNILTNYRDNKSFFEGYTKGSDPYKNQEELLKSRKLAQLVFEQIHQDETRKKGDKQKILLKYPVFSADKLTDMLDAEHIRGTDFIKISVLARDPNDAQTIAHEFVKVYEAQSLKISRKPLVKQKETLMIERQKNEHLLTELNEEIQIFQQENHITDLSMEGKVLVQKLHDLNTQARQLEAQRSAHAAEVADLTKQVGMDVHTAVQSVAQGLNSNLNQLEAQLEKAQQDYEVKALTYAPTNPMMVELQKNIHVLSEQIKTQQIKTVGLPSKTDGSKVNDPVVIQDRVRSDLVLRLASRHAEQKAVGNQAAILRKQADGLNAELDKLPEIQIAYAEKILKRKDLEDVLTRIKAKLTEVEIQITGLNSVIQPHDPPSLPKYPVFPNGFHIMLFSTIICLLLSSAAVIFQESVKEQPVTTELFERRLGLPVLGVLPWVSMVHWKSLRNSQTLEVLSVPRHQPTVKAYQTLAINLQHQMNRLSKNCLATVSVYQEAEQSRILSNLAVSIAQSDKRVVMLDTNLRNPRMHETFGHGLNYEKGLTELINRISVYVNENPDATTDDLAPLVQKGLLETGVHPDLHYINAGVAIENTFEFLNSKGFKGLIQVLREHYDMVLFDAPPLLAGADAFVLNQFVDGFDHMDRYPDGAGLVRN